MKKLFYFGLIGLLIFEVLNVYFIMPMPGSQRMNSISLAYFLYSARWVLRSVFGLSLLFGYIKAKWNRRWVPLIPAVIIGIMIWFMNFRMSADHIFYKPKTLTFSDAAHNREEAERLVLGVEINGKTKAYPIRFLGYHHMVQDTIDGNPVLVTYCTVCRTGRVYEPVVNGKGETFRLVGMDHFNAMFEDVTTGSWWRQESGEAVTGKMKGTKLKQLFFTQTTLGEWLQLHPQSLIMQEDPAYADHYNPGFKYENGTIKSSLVGTDSLSWKDKSWVVGIENGNLVKAYDWNMLKSKRMIDDHSGENRTIIVLAKDNKSFFAFSLPADDHVITFTDDIISYNDHRYRIDGTGIDTSASLKKVLAYQEFWHSWRTFHPNTLRFE